MIVNIRAKGITITPNTQEYIEKKLMNLEKYYQQNDADSSQVDVSIEHPSDKDGTNVYAEVRISVGKKMFIGEAKSSTIEEGIDIVHDKLKTQLQRYKDKMRDHHA